jgi:hypothetical protein
MELNKKNILIIIGILVVIFFIYKMNKSEHLTQEQEVIQQTLTQKYANYISNFIATNSVSDNSGNKTITLKKMSFKVLNNVSQLDEGINNVLLYNNNNILLLGNDGTYDSNGNTNYFIYLLTNIIVELDKDGNVIPDPNSPTNYFSYTAYTGVIKTSNPHPFVYNNGNLQINIDASNNLKYNSDVSGTQTQLILYNTIDKLNNIDFGLGVRKADNSIKKLLDFTQLSKDLKKYYSDTDKRNSLQTTILYNIINPTINEYLKKNPKI